MSITDMLTTIRLILRYVLILVPTALLIADRISEKRIKEIDIGAIQQNYAVSSDTRPDVADDELRTRHNELARAFAELKASVDNRSAVDDILDTEAKFWMLALFAIGIALWDFCVESRNSRAPARTNESRTRRCT